MLADADADTDRERLMQSVFFYKITRTFIGIKFVNAHKKHMKISNSNTANTIQSLCVDCRAQCTQYTRFTGLARDGLVCVVVR